jgi:hypothetical protein
MMTKATRGDRFRRARWTLRVVCAMAILSSGVAHGGVWTSHGPRGGIVRALAVDPTNPSTVYAATSSGGIFKSTNGGNAWSSSSNGIPSLSSYIITDVAVDPATPSRVYATAQTGPDFGLLRSTNGGASWTFDATVQATAIAIDPATPTTLWAVGGADLLKSIDAGLTWSPVLTGYHTFSVAIDPVTPNTVYVGSLDWLLKTIDGGAHWNPVGAGLPSNLQHIPAIAIDPGTPTTLFVGTTVGIYRSIDAGMSWAPVGPAGFYVQALKVDATDPDVVYAGGLGPDDVSVYKSVDGGVSWDPTPLSESTNALALVGPMTLLAGTADTGMFKTTDAAVTWGPANTGLTATAVFSVATNPAQSGNVYSGTLRNGVVRSSDAGGSWTQTTPFYTQGVASIAVDPSAPGTVYAGDGATYGVYKTIDDGDTWTHLNSTNAPLNAYALQLDPSNPSIVYAGVVFGGIIKSPDGGATWTPVNNGAYGIIVSLAIDPSAPMTLYAGAAADDPVAGVFKTTNGGAQWTPANGGLGPVAKKATWGLAVDPFNTAAVYAAFEDAGVYKTIDGGGQWFPVNNGLTSFKVSSIVVDPVIPDTAFVATHDKGVFTTSDGGNSWYPTNAGLTNLDVSALAVEPGRLYAGTIGGGTFVTTVDANSTTTTSTTPTTTSTSLVPPVVLGRSLTIRDPQPGASGNPAKRKIVATASESASTDALDVATLIANGATVTITTFGQVPSSQTFGMPGPWSPLGTTGARYNDKAGVNGSVKSAVVSKSASGTLQIKVNILGKLGPGPQPHVTVVPPNPGFAAMMVLQVNGGGTYCVGYGDAAGGVVSNGGAVYFKISNPTVATCTINS